MSSTEVDSLNAARTGVWQGSWDSGDFADVKLRDPEVSIGSCGNPGRVGPCSGKQELCDDAFPRDSPDLAWRDCRKGASPSDGSGTLREPDVAVRSHCDSPKSLPL